MRVENLALCFVNILQICRSESAYPADVGIQEPPPYAVFPYFLHFATAIQEHGQHPLAQLDYSLILLGFHRFCDIVRRGVLFRNRRNDKSGMQVDERLSKRRKLRIPAARLEILVCSLSIDPRRYLGLPLLLS